MKAKRCPVCGGTPQYVHYAIPGSTKDPDGIFILLKRLECSQCGATVAHLVMTCDDAVRYWNDINEQGNRPVLERISVEPCMDVEEALKGEANAQRMETDT